MNHFAGSLDVAPGRQRLQNEKSKYYLNITIFLECRMCDNKGTLMSSRPNPDNR